MNYEEIINNKRARKGNKKEKEKEKENKINEK